MDSNEFFEGLMMSRGNDGLVSWHTWTYSESIRRVIVRNLRHRPLKATQRRTRASPSAALCVTDTCATDIPIDVTSRDELNLREARADRSIPRILACRSHSARINSSAGAVENNWYADRGTISWNPLKFDKSSLGINKRSMGRNVKGRVTCLLARDRRFALKIRASSALSRRRAFRAERAKRRDDTRREQSSPFFPEHCAILNVETRAPSSFPIELCKIFSDATRQAWTNVHELRLRKKGYGQNDNGGRG